MIIELEVTWTFPTPPTPTPYGVDIYYRLVGDTTYTTSSVTNGESGSTTITILSSTEDTISDRDLSCELDYEGYVVPTCANNAIDQRTPFTTVAVDITDYMQCRGVQAECTTGGIIAVIPDPNPSLIFTTNPAFPIGIDNFSGAGNPALLPGIDNSNIVWTNPSASSSTIARINLLDYEPFGGFDSTTTFDLVGLGPDESTPVTMTPTLVTSCGNVGIAAKACYSGGGMYVPFFGTDGDIVKTCVNNVNNNDYDTTFSDVGEVIITEDYLCCQTAECREYRITWTGVAIMPWMTSFTFGFINPTTGILSFSSISNSSGSITVSAISDTIAVYGNQASQFDMAAFLQLGGVTITDVGSCK